MTEPENEDRDKPKMPEFIVLEDDTYTSSGQQMPRFKKAPPKQTSWRLRFVFLLSSLVSIIWTIGSLFCFLCMGLATLITFNYFPLLKRLTKMYWSWFKGGIVVTLGLIVSFFNFPLGIIIIAYYFSQIQESWQKNIYTRVMYPHMKDYM